MVESFLHKMPIRNPADKCNEDCNEINIIGEYNKVHHKNWVTFSVLIWIVFFSP